jgi:hypothetical protein
LTGRRAGPGEHFMPLTSHDLSVARWCGYLAVMARITKQTFRTSTGAPYTR